MPSTSITLQAAVPSGGVLIVSVPHLRHGDVETGTLKMTLDQVTIPFGQFDYVLSYQNENIEVKNLSQQPWAQGSQAGLTWQGMLIQYEVEALKARVTELEHMDDWITSGELNTGNHQLVTGAGMLGRVKIAPPVLALPAVRASPPNIGQPVDPILMYLIDGIGRNPPEYGLFTIDIAQVDYTTSTLFDIHLPFRTGLYIEIPATQKIIVTWRVGS